MLNAILMVGIYSPIELRIEANTTLVKRNEDFAKCEVDKASELASQCKHYTRLYCRRLDISTTGLTSSTVQVRLVIIFVNVQFQIRGASESLLIRPKSFQLSLKYNNSVRLNNTIWQTIPVRYNAIIRCSLSFETVRRLDLASAAMILHGFFPDPYASVSVHKTRATIPK